MCWEQKKGKRSGDGVMRFFAEILLRVNKPKSRRGRKANKYVYFFFNFLTSYLILKENYTPNVQNTLVNLLVPSSEITLQKLHSKNKIGVTIRHYHRIVDSNKFR